MYKNKRPTNLSAERFVYQNQFILSRLFFPSALDIALNLQKYFVAGTEEIIYFSIISSVSFAIINSSSVGITTTFTFELGVLSMTSFPLIVFASRSISTPI